LDDDPLLNVVYEALVRRAPKSRTFGRLGVPAEIVVRMLLLKHLRNWSFDELEREGLTSYIGNSRAWPRA
jgi:IS5 family transposase